MAIRNISPGERMLEIPRSLQIWDVDALRNEWIKKHFATGAKHRQTGNPVDSAAYLALYLALLQQDKLQQESSRLQEYLKECMPSQEDLESFHPIFWNETELVEYILPHTASFSVVKAYRDMIRSEYKAFVDAFQKGTEDKHPLEDFLSQEAYTRSRTLVLTRCFQAGSSLSQEELQFYRNDFGIDLSRGSYAMVPILDFYDSHPRPNVQYSFNPNQQSFVIQASERGILAGQEIVDSYGKYTDAHLFAKFGFVNGDGSGHSQANLATHHRVMDMDLKQQFSYLPFRRNQPMSEALQKALEKQKAGVRQYLMFDDGYEECISMTSNDNDNNDAYFQEARELKRLKLQHLTRIANHAKRWHLVLLPRAPESLPARTSNMPITYEPPKVSKQSTKLFHRKEYQLIAATCRLISLTHEDYDGRATDLLQANLRNNSFLLESELNEYSERDSLAAGLEFRTHFCLARLASEAFQRFQEPLTDLEDRVATLNRRAFQSKEWTAAHLELSEMQALEVLRGVSFSAAREYEDLRNKYPAFTIRDTPCSTEWD